MPAGIFNFLKILVFVVIQGYYLVGFLLLPDAEQEEETETALDILRNIKESWLSINQPVHWLAEAAAVAVMHSSFVKVWEVTFWDLKNANESKGAGSLNQEIGSLDKKSQACGQKKIRLDSRRSGMPNFLFRPPKRQGLPNPGPLCL